MMRHSDRSLTEQALVAKGEAVINRIDSWALRLQAAAAELDAVVREMREEENPSHDQSAGPAAEASG